MHSDEAPASGSELRIPVDVEHGGIRIAGCGVFALAVLVITGLILLLAPDGLIMGVIAGVVVAALISQPVERRLKAHWPSGRELVISASQIHVEKNTRPERKVDVQRPVQALLWHFRIRRRTRVPKGWHVVACALEQEGLYLPVYTLMSPKDFEKMPMNDQFTLLSREASPETARSDSLSKVRMAGEQRRLHAAERERGLDGAEVTPEAFQNFLSHLQSHYTAWMPQS